MSQNTAPAMALVTVDPRALRPHPQNYNTHDAAQVEELAGSLEQFDQTGKAVVIWRGFILSGHGLVLAAIRRGLQTITAQDKSDWDEATALAWIVADNETAHLSTPDEGKLANLLQRAKEEGKLKGTGYSDARATELLTRLGRIETPDGDYSKVPTTDRAPYQQMTFTLHDDQVAEVKRALEIAQGLGPFGDTQNTNRNGNALARIAELFIADHDPDTTPDR